jgi:biotin synthase
MSGAFSDVLKRVGDDPARASLSDIGILLAEEDEELQQQLFRLADAIRAREMGDAVHLRGVIEFSSHCQADCHYCGLRASNAAASRYRLSPETIFEQVKRGAALGLGTVVLQSGEDPWYDRDTLAELIARIARETPVAITLSLGERSYADLRAFRRAGADRYLLKHETSDPALHRRLRPARTLRRRLRQLSWLRALGYQVGSGCIVGLPGQTLSSLARDVTTLRDLDVEMAGIGPFIPHPSTPLGDGEPGSVELTLRLVAVTRMVLPTAHIAATTAMATLHPQGRELALQAGANVVMPNLTPLAYRRQYEIYPAKACLDETTEHCLGCLRGRIEAIGRTLGRGRGDSPKWELKGVIGDVDQNRPQFGDDR